MRRRWIQDACDLLALVVVQVVCQLRVVLVSLNSVDQCIVGFDHSIEALWHESVVSSCVALIAVGE